MKFSAQSESLNPCQQKLRVEVDAESVRDEFQRVIAQYQRQARLPGFRPGHSPAAMVEKRFAREIEDDVKRTLIPESYHAATREQKMRAVGSPRIENIEFGRNQPLRYVATVETVPDFPLPDYKSLSVNVSEPTVADEDVEKSLELLRDQRAEFVDIKDRGLALGDFAVINFEGISNGKPITEIVPRAKALGLGKKFWLAMDEKSFLPGFCQQLVGAKIGVKREVLVDFPADFAIKDLQSAKATYFVDLVGIKEKKLPPLDDAFAQGFKVPTLAELRQRARDGLLRQHQQRALQEKRNQLVSALLARVNFDLPPTLVTAETRNVIYDTVRALQMRGASNEAIEEQKDKIFGSAQQSAADRVKAQIILARIAEAEKIEVTREEVDHHIAHLAAQHGVPTQQLRAQLEQRDALPAVADEILVDKVLDFLLKNAKVEAQAQ